MTYYGEWTPEEWEAWQAEHFSSERKANVSQRRTLADVKRQGSLSQEAYDVAYNRVQEARGPVTLFVTSKADVQRWSEAQGCSAIHGSGHEV